MIIALIREPDFITIRRNVAVFDDDVLVEGVFQLEEYSDKLIYEAEFWAGHEIGMKHEVVTITGPFRVIRVPIDGKMPGEAGFDLAALLEDVSK